jgi:hypothetical protein
MCPLRHDPPRGDLPTNHVIGQAISIADEAMGSASRLAGDRAARPGVWVVTWVASRFTPTEGERPGLQELFTGVFEGVLPISTNTS